MTSRGILPENVEEVVIDCMPTIPRGLTFESHASKSVCGIHPRQPYYVRDFHPKRNFGPVGHGLSNLAGPASCQVRRARRQQYGGKQRHKNRKFTHTITLSEGKHYADSFACDISGGKVSSERA